MIPLFSSPPRPRKGMQGLLVTGSRIWPLCPFVTSGLSACELFLLALRLWCSKACFWKNKYSSHPPPPNNGAIYLQHQHKSLLFVCPNRVPGSQQEIASSGETCGNLQATYTNPWIVVFLYLKKKNLSPKYRSMCFTLGVFTNSVTQVLIEWRYSSLVDALVYCDVSQTQMIAGLAPYSSHRTASYESYVINWLWGYKYHATFSCLQKHS